MFPKPDSCHGKVFISNTFFLEKPKLSQDSFIPGCIRNCKPIGICKKKKKHKVLAVYFSLLKWPTHLRSNTDHVELVLLCTEKDFK